MQLRVVDIIIQEWELDASLHSKEEILMALAARIDQMLRSDPVGFIQTMYRLDIPEAQLEAAMDGMESAHLIAALVWERQIQKAAMRRIMTPPRTDDKDELTW